MAGPFQMEVLFEEFPEKLDTQALKTAIDSLESQEEPCEVSEYRCVQEEGRQVGSFSVRLGDMQVAGIVHASTMPEEIMRSTVEVMALPDSDKQAAATHKAYALITCLGGEEYHPVEPMVLLLKIAMTLCEQGAMGAANEQSAMYLPADILVNTAQAARLVDAEVTFDRGESDLQSDNGSSLHTHEEEEEAWHEEEDEEEEDEEDEEEEEEDEEEPLTLWDSVRFGGDPYYLLANVLPIEREGKLYFASIGHSQFDLPELLAAAQSYDEYGHVRQVFEDVFSFMMANGPVISANETMGYDDQTTIHFSELPEELAELQGDSGRLMVGFEQSSES